MYAVLEELGIRFDVLGPILPARIDLSSLLGRSLHVRPRVRLRGIRQHLNFPMDISSYPLAEAREYVRNLARLQLNHLTLHSYDGQWFACRLAAREIQAGSFFYGQHHPVPDHPVVGAALRNRRVFCIPELEPYHDRAPERSAAARNLARNLELVRLLPQELGKRCPALTLGVYVTCAQTLKVILALLRRYSPAEVTWAFLPAHGGRGSRPEPL